VREKLPYHSGLIPTSGTLILEWHVPTPCRTGTVQRKAVQPAADLSHAPSLIQFVYNTLIGDPSTEIQLELPTADLAKKKKEPSIYTAGQSCSCAVRRVHNVPLLTLLPASPSGSSKHSLGQGVRRLLRAADGVQSDGVARASDQARGRAH
jgi:hypothetical protein